jgi:alpha-N-arabinofuranosidase
VSEAVFLLGAERNADRIWGASFAPLLQNLNSYQWTPDLIAFTADPADTTVSTSYPVIQLLSGTRITHTLPAKTVEGDFGPAYWVAGRDDSAYILKAAVYNSTGDVPFSVGFEGLKPGAPAQLTVLTAPALAQNTPQHKEEVTTKVEHLTAGADGSIKFSLPNLSVAVLRAKF